jgi:hypothetical protein
MADSSCRCCGTCCTAPDIASLGKPLGVRCPHLGDDLRCSIYALRPVVCRNYLPDEICVLIAAPALEERVNRYLRLFGLR